MGEHLDGLDLVASVSGEGCEASPKQRDIVPFHGEERLAAGTQRLAPLREGSRALALLVLLQHDVTTASVHAQGADTSAARAVGAISQPILGLPGEQEIPWREVCSHGAQPAYRRQHLLVEAERRLDHRGQGPGGAGVANVRLHTAEVAHGGHVAWREERAERLGLDAVLDVVPASVRLDVADQGRVEIRLLIGARESPRVRVGRGQGHLRRPPRSPTEAADHGVDPVAVTLCVLQAFEDQGRRSLAHHGAVRVGVEGPGAPARRVVTDSVGREHGAHVTGEVHCTHEAAVQLTLLQGADTDLQGAHARRLLAGDRVAGTTDAELPGDSAGDDAPQSSHGAVGRQRRHRMGAHTLVH